MRKQFFTVLIMVLLVLPIVMAAPPFQSPDVNQGYQVVFPKLNSFCYGDNITLNYHLHNQSNHNVNAVSIECMIHLYNNTGDHIITDFLINDGKEWGYEVNTTELNYKGSYYYFVWCNDSTLAGFESAGFEVTQSCHVIPEDSNAYLPITIFLLLIALGFFVIPFVVEKFHSTPWVDLIIKRGFLIIGLFLMSLNTAIIMVFADGVLIPIMGELRMYLFLFGYGGYIMMLLLVIKTIFDLVKSFREGAREKRTG